MNKDYYQILGIPKEASKEEIKKAFRAMTAKYHPDKEDGDEEKYKEVTEAYAALGEPASQSEDETESQEDVVIVKDIVEVTEQAEVTAAEKTDMAPVGEVSLVAKVKKCILRRKYTIAAVALVIVALAGLLYIMEEQGRVETGVFDGIDRMVATRTTVAKVNEGKVSRYDLDVSMAQISSGAALQGADIEDPEIQAEIEKQALDMLVNTELLKQEATAREITITDEDVTARYEQLKVDVGGEDVLNERMAEFGINKKTLFRDIHNELTIQALLKQVFEQKNIEVSDAEVKEFYDAAGGETAGLPKLEEVKEQIIQQIKSGKEQEIVTGFVTELRGNATIEILI